MYKVRIDYTNTDSPLNGSIGDNGVIETELPYIPKSGEQLGFWRKVEVINDVASLRTTIDKVWTVMIIDYIVHEFDQENNFTGIEINLC